MFLTRSILLCAMLLLVAPAIEAQENSQHVLLEEFGAFSCSEFRGSTDQFMAELAKDPDSYGYVVNSGPIGELTSLVLREEQILSQVELRRFDRSRIFFERSESTGEIRTRFWKLFRSDSKPKLDNVNNSLSLADVSKPFILTEETFHNDSECPDVNYSRLFARFLEANPRSRGNLVVYGDSRNELRSRERMAISSLTQAGISRKRIRVFHRLVPHDPEHPKGVEYWYLP